MRRQNPRCATWQRKLRKGGAGEQFDSGFVGECSAALFIKNIVLDFILHATPLGRLNMKYLNQSEI